jgi:hypothetical protein
MPRYTIATSVKSKTVLQPEDPFGETHLHQTIAPFAITQYSWDALRIARLVADDFLTFDTGDTVEILILTGDNNEVWRTFPTKKHEEAKTEEPTADFEPYDGVPADTGSV